MAPKKTPAKTAAKGPGTSLAKWDELLAQQADIAASVTGGSGGSFISFQGGIIKIDGNPIPGNKLSCVVTGHIFENALYQGAYDPDNPQPPVCYAYGTKQDEMRPHEDSVEPQGGPTGMCHDCPMNEWKSAGGSSKGKACKNMRRLGFIAGDEDSLNATDIESAEVKYAKTPVTSAKEWDGYVQQMATTLRRPPFALVTEITTAPDPKTQFKLKIKLLAKIDNSEVFDALLEKHKITMEKIVFPYQAPSEPVAPQRGRGAATRQQPNKFAATAKKQITAKKQPARGRGR